MPSTAMLDTCGRRPAPATLPSFHRGRPPPDKGQRYPADPPTVEEIVAVMHVAGDDPDAVRLRGLIVVLRRPGPADQRSTRAERERPRPNSRRSSGPARQGREAPRGRNGPMGPGATGCWLELRAVLPVGALFCVLRGPTCGRPWAPAGVRAQFHAAAARAGVRRRFAPHQLRHAHARAKACRCWSYSASSATRTSRSPRCTSAESTTPRSSMPSASGRRR